MHAVAFAVSIDAQRDVSANVSVSTTLSFSSVCFAEAPLSPY
jgi:hypothetical protein